MHVTQGQFRSAVLLLYIKILHEECSTLVLCSLLCLWKNGELNLGFLKMA